MFVRSELLDSMMRTAPFDPQQPVGLLQSRRPRNESNYRATAQSSARAANNPERLITESPRPHAEAAFWAR